jgi:hypothetical protein
VNDEAIAILEKVFSPNLPGGAEINRKMIGHDI